MAEIIDLALYKFKSIIAKDVFNNDMRPVDILDLSDRYIICYIPLYDLYAWISTTGVIMLEAADECFVSPEYDNVSINDDYQGTAVSYIMPIKSLYQKSEEGYYELTL